ncbi:MULTISPECIES: TetR/AcrR family transcriptional regulator [unclassified Streptomyces]|uniref:TetR/AcrR family transcriptional regulator n=1 Tax=unclassified Streptomyces TaxID=2593676 RepID=UPI001EF2240C|nr:MULTISPECIES: TetR/AcrR family transcriptional regulator [unclassified Streptomyces]
MTAIAKQAGVGVGTLYRHFPTREALIVELYHQEIQKVIDLAHTLAASLPPLDALRRWFNEVARYGELKYGVAEVIHAATNGGLDDENYEPFLGAIAVLLAAGVADGTLKPGTDPEDVLLQLSVLWRIPRGRRARHAPHASSISSSTACAPDLPRRDDPGRPCRMNGLRANGRAGEYRCLVRR